MADKRTKKRKPYTLKQTRLIGSHALMVCENILLSPETTTEYKLRAANAISTLLNSFGRITEISELEERIEQLEQQSNLKRVS